MSRLCLVLAFVFVATTALAERWYSELFHCTLTLPDNETWTRKGPDYSVAGEMIFNAEHKESVQRMTVCVIKLPSNNLTSPGTINRIIECLKSQGFSVDQQETIKIEDQPFLQLTGQRKVSPTITLIGAARATLRSNTVYVALTYAPGEESLAKDPNFLRVLDTFRLTSEQLYVRHPETEPYFRYYKLGYLACWATAGGLAMVFGVTMFLTRRRTGM